MEGVRGQVDTNWDVFTGNEASVGLLPETQPLDRDRAGIRANNRFSANYEARLNIVVGVYNTLLKRPALPVDRPFPLPDGVPLALNHPKEIFRDGVTISCPPHVMIPTVLKHLRAQATTVYVTLITQAGPDAFYAWLTELSVEAPIFIDDIHLL